MRPTYSQPLTTVERSHSKKSIFEYLEDPKAAATLPSLKSVLNELEMLTQKNNMRLDEVTQLVQVDQGMSLRVLRMANSVYYSPSVPIMDVQDAILYIGLNTFRGAVASTRCIEKLANKLLVMIDGRTVYTPLFSGVFWDVQDYLLEDIEQIEVISGPGGTLWGANAVNGVINIITRKAGDTQGTYVEGGGGNQLQEFAGVRYGAAVGDTTQFRFMEILRPR